MKNKQKNKPTPCFYASCVFENCVNYADGNDGIVCDVAPCQGFGTCPLKTDLPN